MSVLNISVDDLRPLPENYQKVFRTAEDFLAWYQAHPHATIQRLTLDHDLGLNGMSGYDLVKELIARGCPRIQYIQFHTNNVVGFTNMLQTLQGAQRHGLVPASLTISSCRYQQTGQRLVKI